MIRSCISRTLGIAIGLVALAGLLPATASAAAPAWSINAYPYPTSFPPSTAGIEDTGPAYYLIVRNAGTATTSGAFEIVDTLPSGVTASASGAKAVGGESAVGGTVVGPIACNTVLQTVTCAGSGELRPGELIEVRIPVDVGATEGPIVNQASVSGGGAPEAATTQVTSAIETGLPPFGLLPGLPGFHTQATRGDGLAATEAGSHPSQLSVGLTLPTRKPKPQVLAPIESLRDSIVELPPGAVVNPNATPQCTEAELVGGVCPLASQVGLATVSIPSPPRIDPKVQPIFNMVPPPGSAASLGFNVAGIGVYEHVLGGVRGEDDFRAVGTAADISAKVVIFEVHVDLWGSPHDSSHDYRRASCFTVPKFCPEAIAEPSNTAFLTLPTKCSGPLTTSASIDSWQHPGVFKEASAESLDAGGTPVGIEGCNQLEFEPTVEARPTTNLADSPSGLDFELHQPQNLEFDQLSPANLRDATVTLPEGMAANAAQANGLEVCTTGQIGYRPHDGEIHFSEDPADCPNAAKLGTVEASTPLLDHPLAGAVYIAKPFDNPFDSLLAIYIAIEDPQTGVIAKLAGKVTPDPVTGQLSTRFTENPDLPLEDVRLHFFEGARAALITPPTCGTHTTTSRLTPWSSPATPDATPSDSFATIAAPGGGACPGNAAAAPNAPSFTAGTLAPQAGAFSELLFKLSREDGSQRLAGVDATMPPGLSGKLAGVAQCSEAQIAAAAARANPDEGALEKASPSCPASSRVGTVTAGAGAGPTPIFVQGQAYLAGPYKGAPLSLAVITPAVAGPFDLGTVVVRIALYVDPTTARIHAVSDPLPSILAGIPLDLRSVALRLDRPEFTLNPTSCDPMSILGTATSTLGQSAALLSPFQVGGCSSLPFKPKLSLRLKGGTKRAAHPKLIANLRAGTGEANIARAQVKLPPSAFLDQAHIRTVCTRVQFAADACPKGSIYGKASATTPLLDYPLSGNVYLRSSSHKLPDLVVDLRGPDYQPIRIELAGKTDSVRGALRNTFEAVPDAPVSKFHLELFGGKRGLVVNSRDLCAHRYRAEVQLDGQNGKTYDTKPAVGTGCKGGKGRKKGHRR